MTVLTMVLGMLPLMVALLCSNGYKNTFKEIICRQQISAGDISFYQ